ncbi:ABC transporter permease subunit [Rhodobacteraceae bacterium Araon29]
MINLKAKKNINFDDFERAIGDEMKGRSLWVDARIRYARNKMATICLFTLILVGIFSIFGNYFAAYSIEEIDWAVLGMTYEKGYPSLETGHYFGTDEMGRDLYARVVQGSRISLAVGFIGAFISTFVGTIYGAISGYIGGRVDGFMMRIVDILISIPFMFVLILFLVVFGRSILMIFVGIALFSWLGMARVARGQTMTLKNKEFIEAARAIGVSQFTIVIRHIVPNLLGIVIVYGSLMIPGFIMTESFISFLGLGVQEPNTSWGSLIFEGASTMTYGTIWQLAFPLFFFTVTMFCFYFIGDGLRDAFDPKDR